MSVKRWCLPDALPVVLVMLSACSPQAERIAIDDVVDAESATRLAPSQLPAPDIRESVRVFIDPVTEEIREPTAEEESAAARGESLTPSAKPAARIREIHLPDGSIASFPEQAGKESLQGCVRSDDTVAIDHACAKPAASEASGE